MKIEVADTPGYKLKLIDCNKYTLADYISRSITYPTIFIEMDLKRLSLFKL